jgi:hypothetical protein
MSKTCALIDEAAGEVINIVMGTKEMWKPDGHLIVEDPPTWVVPGTKWNGDFVEPEPPASLPSAAEDL